jgi:S1-C subfamily serine protease
MVVRRLPVSAPEVIWLSKSCLRQILIVSVAMAAVVLPVARAQSTPPVFELDCVSFAGRFLAGAPIKKKPYPGLAVDGTVWSISPDDKRVSIARVFPAEAAEKAGIEVGDEVLSVNGYPTAGSTLRDLFAAYHMYDPATLSETLVVRKKDGTEKTVKLTLLPADQANAEEKNAWLSLYQAWGY